MGLLDRWTKKQEAEQLKKLDKKDNNQAEKTEKTVKKAKPVKKVVKAEEKTETTATAKKTKVGGIAYKILVRPLITEKSAVMQSHNKYSFIVANSATKDQVKQAISEAYGVRPITVNIFNVSGRRVRFGKTMGRRSDYKKAIATLAVGQSISIHEGV